MEGIKLSKKKSFKDYLSSIWDYKKMLINIFSLLLIFFLSYALYSYILNRLINDFSTHIDFSISLLDYENKIIGNFIFYWLLNFLSGFSKNSYIVGIILRILLSLTTTVKFYWTQRNISKIGDPQKYFCRNVFFALCMMIVFVIPIPSYFLKGYFYIGNFVPNIWHNSTTIFLFPFALILFSLTAKQLKKYSPKRDIWIIVLLFFNIYIKPSYFFVWVCIYPLMLLINYKFSKTFWRAIIPVVIGVLFLTLEYFVIYFFKKGGGVYAESSVVVAPFDVYSQFLPPSWLPVTFLFSLLFPILYFIFNYKKVYKNKLFLFSYLCLLLSIIIYLLFAETGNRRYDANFSWQVIICVWICYFISLSELLKDIRLKRSGKKINVFLMIIFFIHVFFGFLYLRHYFLTGSYL